MDFVCVCVSVCVLSYSLEVIRCPDEEDPFQLTLNKSQPLKASCMGFSYF